MKKMFNLLLILIFLFTISCSKKMEYYSGTYELEYYKFVGDADTEKNTSTYITMVLNSNGTGIINRDGLNIDIKWLLDDNNIKITEISGEDNMEYNGTITDNRIVLFNGDKKDFLTKEEVYVKKWNRWILITKCVKIYKKFDLREKNGVEII